MARSGIYPNAPLTEAVFEIRFPGEPAVECRRDELFQAVRRQFSQVYVPKVTAGQLPALQPYHFRNEAGTRDLIIALNRFAFSVKKYNGYTDFKRDAMKYMLLFGKRFKLRRLTRTGLRYINVIPFTRESGLLPLDQYFRLRLDFPPAQPMVTSNLSLGYVVPLQGGSLTTRIECVVSEDKREAFVLDFDYAKTYDLLFASVQDYLDESHRETKRFFESIVTEEYKKFMKGEVVE